MADTENPVRIEVRHRNNQGNTAYWVLMDGDLKVAEGGFYPPQGTRESKTLMVSRATMDALLRAINELRQERLG